jgi:selenocysteine-specific elongation factor
VADDSGVRTSAATVVVGTAGHIDHGKTTLLRALTGIDADRLPEERERGMTIDVGFAHLALDDGSAIDFVDVPGHDRLVGNMLVGAGEIDGVLLVVAADDGPRAQTFEHLELLDALGLERAVVAVTKVDAVEAPRVDEVTAAVRSIVDRTAMAGAPIVAVSGVTGDGLPELRARLVELRDRLHADRLARPTGPLRLPIDRAFAVRGRGTVVTGTLRGGSVAAGTTLRLEPDAGREVRVREVQVHHGRAERADAGRTALNLGGVEAAELRRGQVLTAGRGIESTDRLLVALHEPVEVAGSGRPVAWPPSSRAALRWHLWTESVDAAVGPADRDWIELDGGAPAGREGGSVAGLVRLARPVAALVGARAVLRDPGSSRIVAGATVLDPRPPRGVSRRRATPERIRAVASAVAAAMARAEPAEGVAVTSALTELHGFRGGELAPDVAAALSRVAIERAAAAAGIGVSALRSDLARALRRLVTVDRSSGAAAAAVIDRLLGELVEAGRLSRVGDRVVEPGGRAAVADRLAVAMDRLERALDVNVPPMLAEAARTAGCPPEGLRGLEASGRIVRVSDDLAWSATRYAALRDRALELAGRGPLPPAAFRDAIGGNRRVALALLEDFDRRGYLRRTDAGHVLGPRAKR